MTVSIAVVCEARADCETACCLADRVLVEDTSLDWIDAETVEHYRQWRGYTRAEPMLLWADVHALGREKGVVKLGHFEGLPGSPDAYVARRALLLLDGSPDRPDAVLLQRDADDQPERREGLDQAREAFRSAFPVVIGLAITKRECWVLAGFEPRTPDEEERLAARRQELGFDPRLRSHELTAKQDHHARSAKRVLKALTDGDRDRELLCLRETNLRSLEERGTDNGLASFLNEIRERLLPLFRPAGQPDTSA